MVVAKDLKYLWIGLACWIGTVAVGIALDMDRRHRIVLPILAAMLLIPIILILMADWKRHYFVGNTLLVLMVPYLLVFSPAYFPSQRGVREAARRMQSAGNLRQTVIAMHNYHEKHNHFPPPAITALDGTPLLSWRVIILPYLGEEKLFNEFHLNEPWDSEHNRNLIARMPEVYKDVGRVVCPKHHTFIQAFVGPGTILDPQRRVTLGEITLNRGTSNTALAAEGGHPVIWTKPEDIPFTLENGISPIGGQFPVSGNYVRVNIAFADGSIRGLRPPFPMEALREAVQWKSTKPVENAWDY